MEGGSRSGDERGSNALEDATPSSGSTKTCWRSRTKASTTALRFFLIGWKRGHDASASVLPATQFLRRAMRLV